MVATKQTGKTIDNDIDALFKLPLTEFIAARKILAAQLKQAGHASMSERVKVLAKPSISVWAVNQLYWHHRDEFEALIAAGQRFRRAHTSRSGKAADLNEALEARREALNRLSDLASALLTSAGHSPTMDTMRRIATTLEAMSAYAVLPEDQAAGRLTKDLDPPGFESLAPFIRAVATTRRPEETLRVEKPNKTAGITKTQPNSATIKDARRAAETRQAKLAAAKAAVQEAKKSLADARAKAHALQSSQKKADAEAKHAEKQKRDAEQRFREASAASAAAAVRAENIQRELERAGAAVDDAERAVATAAKELGSLSRD
jgi:hypothetical protein